MANASLQCIPEFVRFCHRKNAIVQHCVNSDTIARMLLSAKHLLLGNPHIDPILGRFREIERGQLRQGKTMSLPFANDPNFLFFLSQQPQTLTVAGNTGISPQSEAETLPGFKGVKIESSFQVDSRISLC